MTLEEAQNEILKLQDSIKVLQTENDSLKIQTEKDATTIKDLNSNIDKMREHNNALFLRVSQNNFTKEKDTDKDGNTKEDKGDVLDVDALSDLLLNK